jgi:hypothetical protein
VITHLCQLLLTLLLPQLLQLFFAQPELRDQEETFFPVGSVPNSLAWFLSWAWWYMSVIPRLRRLKQEENEFKARMGYIASSTPAWHTY